MTVVRVYVFVTSPKQNQLGLLKVDIYYLLVLCDINALFTSLFLNTRHLNHLSHHSPLSCVLRWVSLKCSQICSICRTTPPHVYALQTSVYWYHDGKNHFICFYLFLSSYFDIFHELLPRHLRNSMFFRVFTSSSFRQWFFWLRCFSTLSIYLALK